MSDVEQYEPGLEDNGNPKMYEMGAQGGRWVLASAFDAIEARLERTVEALRIARHYVVTHSPAALVSEVRLIDAVLAKPAEHEQACANCGKPYRAHLLHDGNKCALGSLTGWFPKQVADAVNQARAVLAEATGDEAMKKQSVETQLRHAKRNIRDGKRREERLCQELRQRRQVGQMMSNLCFNLAQDKTYDPAHRQSMSDCREMWDKIGRVAQ